MQLGRLTDSITVVVFIRKLRISRDPRNVGFGMFSGLHGTEQPLSTASSSQALGDLFWHFHMSHDDDPFLVLDLLPMSAGECRSAALTGLCTLCNDARWAVQLGGSRDELTIETGGQHPNGHQLDIRMFQLNRSGRLWLRSREVRSLDKLEFQALAATDRGSVTSKAVKIASTSLTTVRLRVMIKLSGKGSPSLRLLRISVTFVSLGV